MEGRPVLACSCRLDLFHRTLFIRFQLSSVASGHHQLLQRHPYKALGSFERSWRLPDERSSVRV
jgi:hypothetical protein